MASYQQITNIKLYNCALPHDNAYVVDFNSRSACDTYFSSPNDSFCKLKKTYSNANYQRENFSIMVNDNADTLNSLGINYCRYNNPEFNGMWFYAFVVAINYIAPKTTELIIKLDPWTTYFDRIETSRCFIEREHVEVDSVVALNEIPCPEPIDIEPSEICSIQEFGLNMDGMSDQDIKDNYLMAVCSSERIDLYDVTPVGYIRNEFVGAVPNVFYWYAISLTNIDDFAAAIDKEETGELNIRSAAIISIQLIPKKCCTTEVVSERLPSWLLTLKDEVAPNSHKRSFQLSLTQMFNGYTPKNKKLLTFPYQKLMLTDFNGSTVDLQPEKFTVGLPYGASATNIHFFTEFAMSAASSLGVYPCNYNTEQDQYDPYANINYENAIYYNTFTEIPLNTSAYNQYMSLHKNELLGKGVATLTNAIGAGLSFYTGSVIPLTLASYSTQKIRDEANSFTVQFDSKDLNKDLAKANNLRSQSEQARRSLNARRSQAGGVALSSALSLASDVIGLGLNVSTQQAQPNIVTSPPTSNLSIKAGFAGPHLVRKAISAEQAKRIDKYFNHYGYQVNKFEAFPQWRSRSVVNYIKTHGLIISGEIPQEYKEYLSVMINNGLTVFHGAENYGDFVSNNPIINSAASLDNKPYQ